MEKNENLSLINYQLEISARDEVIADLVALTVPLEADRKNHAKSLIAKKIKELIKIKEKEV